MPIYIHKNGRQLGPFEVAQVLDMFRNGQLSPNDKGIRTGESLWQPLGDLFPTLNPSVSLASSANIVANNGGCRKAFGTGLLLLGCLLFVVEGFCRLNRFFRRRKKRPGLRKCG